MPISAKNELVFPENSLFLGIDYHLLALILMIIISIKIILPKLRIYLPLALVYIIFLTPKFHFSLYSLL